MGVWGNLSMLEFAEDMKGKERVQKSAQDSLCMHRMGLCKAKQTTALEFSFQIELAES